MTYAAHLASLSRTPVTYVVLTLDYCSRTFGVAPCTATGTKCWNTYFTCKDPTNYGKTTKEYTFSSIDAPVPWAGPRPYILSADYLPTEIKDSITVGARCKIELQDEPDGDVGIDPYLSTRTPPVLGTYFQKLMARNPNYEGRTIEVYDGFYGDAVGEFQKRFKGKIDMMNFSGQGRFMIEAVDMLQALDAVDVPPKLDVKLVANMTAAQTTVTTSDATDLDTSGYVRIDNEIIAYSGKSGNQLTGGTRAQFGTTAATHSSGAKIQKCRRYTSTNPFDLIKTTFLQTDGGYAAADVDETTFDYWKATPGGDVNIDAIISEPTRLSDLIKEVCQLFDLRMWQDETQKITIARPLPNNPDTTYATVSDTEHIIAQSTSVNFSPKNYPVVVSSDQRSTGSKQVNASRVSRLTLRWDKSAVGAMDDDASYARINQAINTTSEGANAYNSVAEAEIRTRWLRAASYTTEEERDEDLESICAHYIFLRSDPLPIISLDVELKDAEIFAGNFARLSTDELVNTDGSPYASEKFMVVRREPSGSKINLKLLKLAVTRIGFIAADDTPAYDSATVAQLEYGFVTDDNGRINDKPGYYIW